MATLKVTQENYTHNSYSTNFSDYHYEVISLICI